MRKILFYFGAYHLLNLIFYMAIISVVIFFHFLLDYGLLDIEHWVFDKKWEIFALTRIPSVYLLFKILMVKFTRRKSLKKTLITLRGNFQREIWVCILFLFLGFILLGAPGAQPSHLVSLPKIFISYLSSSLMLLSDCFIILLLNLLYPLKKPQEKWMPLSLASLSILTLSLSFGHPSPQMFFLFFGLFMGYFFLKYNDEWEYIHTLVFCLFFFSPMISLFGIDPLWQGSHALLPMENQIGLSHILVLGGVTLGYLCFKKKQQRL